MILYCYMYVIVSPCQAQISVQPYMVLCFPSYPTAEEVDPVLGVHLSVIDLKPWHKRDLEIRPLPDRYALTWGEEGGGGGTGLHLLLTFVFTNTC